MGTWSQGVECRSPEPTGMLPAAGTQGSVPPDPLTSGRSGLPTGSKRTPVAANQKGPLFVASQRPPTLRRNRGPTHLLFGVSHRYTGPPCLFGCAIDHTSGANAPFCDGWHKLDPARGRETRRSCSPLARLCHEGRSGLHRRAIGPGSEAADIPLMLVRVKIGYVANVPQCLTVAQSRRCRIRSSNVLCSSKIRNGVAHGATKPGKDGSCSGCAAGGGWHSRDA